MGKINSTDKSDFLPESDNNLLDDWFDGLEGETENATPASQSLEDNFWNGTDGDVSEAGYTDGVSGISALRTGPEVGQAELNSLADLFDGETPELDDAWETSDLLEELQAENMSEPASVDETDAGDLSDLLFFDEETNDSPSQMAESPVDSLWDLAGNNDFGEFLDDAIPEEKVRKHLNSADFGHGITPDLPEPSLPEELNSNEDLSDLFGDLSDTDLGDLSANNAPKVSPVAKVDLNGQKNGATAGKSSKSSSKNIESNDFDLNEFFAETSEMADMENNDLDSQSVLNTGNISDLDFADLSSDQDVDSQTVNWSDLESWGDDSQADQLEADLLNMASNNSDMGDDLADLFGDQTSSNHGEVAQVVDQNSDLGENLFDTDDNWLNQMSSEQPASENNDLDWFGTGDENSSGEAGQLLDNLLETMGENPASSPTMDASETDIFSQLEDLLGDATVDHAPRVSSNTNQFNSTVSAQTTGSLGAVSDEFAELEALLASGAKGHQMYGDVFVNLHKLLEGEKLGKSAVVASNTATAVKVKPTETKSVAKVADPFSDLKELLPESADGDGGRGMASRGGTTRQQKITEQVIRVPAKQLDNLSNMMGELVVNRNSLEQGQERMRQCLDNLIHQVTLLNDVGQRMHDLYEKTLLERAIKGRRGGIGRAVDAEDMQSQHDPSHAKRKLDDELDLDRPENFTPFHLLAQESTELIVRVRESASDIEFLVDEADQVTRQLRQVTNQLQEGLTKARMIPFDQTVQRLQRPVRDNALKCGKEAELYVEGKETLIDKMIQEKLFDPMVHLVNNAIAHGIELPEERLAKGKPAKGKITIKVFHQGNQTVISIADDGAGINPDRVKQKALEKGLVTPDQAKQMTNLDVYDLLFHPGFSTKDVADNMSGRGVGMDVVKTSLNDLRGAITTDSTLGKGTVFTIRLPLTLSISKALCCISDRSWIAFPMDGVEDMIKSPKEDIHTDADGQSYIDWRGSKLPFRHLRELLVYNRHLRRGSVYGMNSEDDVVSVVVLRSAGSLLAVQVDQVLEQQKEIVIKQLEGPVPKPLGIAGATVLGDGKIVAIADVIELINLATGRVRRDEAKIWSPEVDGRMAVSEMSEAQSEPTVLIVDDSITVRELLSMSFTKAGYRVEQARDGQDAWEKLRSGLPCDIVFCDIEMPRMDGLELLSRMQKDPGLSRLPIAMLTSRGATKHKQMAFDLGARGYFTKPYLEDHLLDAANRMLQGEIVGAIVSA
jgi:chemosensory pili system protein ChpA (sensor histidine kinase/response regulator)